MVYNNQPGSMFKVKNPGPTPKDSDSAGGGQALGLLNIKCMHNMQI